MKRKILRLLAVLVILSVLIIPIIPLEVGATSGSIDVTLTGSTNDGYILDSSSYNNNGTLLYTGNSFDTFSSWEKFDGITIPAGATITAAYMSCYVSSITGSPTTKIYADDGSGASPVAPTTYGDYLGKTITTASVAWNAMAGSGYINSPSLVTIIQELVNSYTYSSGSIQILFKDNSSGSGNYFEFYSADFGNAPKLHIEYTATHTPTTYYVRTDGNDANTGLSNDSGHAWLTIQKALNTAVASDTVNIVVGTYTCTDLTCANSGTLADGYITYQNYNGGTVNITDGGSVAYKSGIDTNSKNYLKFIGLNFTGNANTYYGLYINHSDHILFQNCKQTVTVSSGIQANTSTYVTLDGCEIYATNSGYAEECISMVTCDHFEIKNCKVHDPASTQRLGIDMKVGCTNGSVHNNEVYNLSGMWQGGIYIDAQSTATHDINIYNNLIHDIPLGDAFSVGDELGTATISNINIYNNISYNCGLGTLSFGVWNTEIYTNVWFINNTSYNNATYTALWPEFNLIGQKALPPAQATNIIIRNNIIWNISATQQTGVIDTGGCYTGGKLLIDHNDWYNSGAGWYTDSTHILGDTYILTNPLLTSPTTDFSLTSSSPAINAGSATSAPATDYIGTSRPQGTYFDIGAYELSTPAAVSTLSTSNITDTTATLNGNLSSMGNETSVVVTFEYGLTTSYGQTATAAESPLTTTGNFHADVTGLSTGTVVHFRIKAVGVSTAYSADSQFTTTGTAGTNPFLVINQISSDNYVIGSGRSDNKIINSYTSGGGTTTTTPTTTTPTTTGTITTTGTPLVPTSTGSLLLKYLLPLAIIVVTIFMVFRYWRNPILLICYFIGLMLMLILALNFMNYI